MYDFDYYLDRYNNTTWGEVNEDDKLYNIEDLEDSFLCFYVYTFSYLELPSPSQSQLEIARFISDRSNPHRIVFGQRGISKSLASQIYVAWRLFINPDEKIIVMSAGSDRAKSYTQFVKKLIGLLPATKPLYPKHNVQRTSSQSFDVAGSSPSDSSSLYAAGVGNSITGMRSSLNIYDDVESHLTVQSAALTDKLNESIAETHNLLMSGKDESIALATPHSTSSIYINWIENGTKLFAVPGLYPESDENYFGGLAPFIKEARDADRSLIGRAVDDRLNQEFLDSKLMRIGKSKFKLQYMLDVSESDALRYPLKLSDFIVDDVDDDIAPLKITYSSMPDNMLYMKHHGFKSDKLYQPMYRSQETAEYDFKCMSIDPSGLGSDGTGITIGYHLNSKIFIKKAMNIDGGYSPDTLTNIATLAATHNINSIIVESNMGDGMFAKMLEPYIIKLSPTTEIEEVRATTNKENRIIDTIEPILNQHRLVIDKSILDTDYNSSRDYSLTHQLTHITREKDSIRHDDIVDSLSQLISFMLEWMSDDEDRGLEYHTDAEAKKTLEFTLQNFGGRSRQTSRPNFGQRF